jgi:RHS repeat-associated protein
VTDTYYTYSSARSRSDYTYDGRQRLRKRVDYTWSTQYSQWQVSAETRYIYAGNLVIQERNSSNTPTVSYVRGTDLSGSREGAGGIGGLLARSDQYSAGTWGRHVFYHADRNGNVTYLVEASQGVAAKYRYDPFGNPTYTSGTLATANAYRFSTKAAQPNSGSYYYGYRFHDPYLQRWLSRDPAAEYGGRNLYSAVLNDPLSVLDRYGLKWAIAPVPPTRLHNTTVCRRGKPVPEVQHFSMEVLMTMNDNSRAQYFCVLKCISEHERSHIKDILAQDASICVGVPDGTYIMNQDRSELVASETAAHEAELACLKECKKTCPGIRIDNRIKDVSETEDNYLMERLFGRICG